MAKLWAAALLSSLLWTSLAAQALARPPPSGHCPQQQQPAEAVTPPLDLNTADEAALQTLPGIGPARARAILEFRQKHGRFTNVSQLLRIRGIGRAMLRRLKPLVTVSDPGGDPALAR
jgi:competence protein ComEA